MEEILNIVILKFDRVQISIGSILLILLGYGITKMIVFLLSKALRSFFNRRKIDIGRSHAVIQFIQYLAILIFIFFALNVIGIKLTYVLTGSAALLVGVGIGLQQTFNDFFSGLILLFEGTVEVGDQLQLAKNVGTVKKIGLRTSKVETRDKHIIIIPNSKLVSNEVVNLSHMSSPVRFSIDIQTSYESDIDHVEKVLLRVMEKYPPVSVAKKYDPIIHIEEFREYGILFRIYFFSAKVMQIEYIKSDIRKDIYKALRANNINIPYPQLELRQEKHN